ncbi:E3 ubiquitin-protein ligase TRIM45-like isoform X2 [Amphiura filiformis]|uniref:E3 ubiquitin-protein ligase TRIM45-like isoform X2 n=1 Tax=Amphiura filiformis TaxID=82378 RepID=UPI003B221074
MAESKPISNNKDLTECGICLCTIEEPKALPCLHTFCLKCLSQWAEGKKDIIRCPICVQDFSIPGDGVKAFRTNFFINTLKDRQATAMTLQSRDTVPCASCGAVDERIEGHCSACGGFICGGCIAMHSKLKIYSNHKVIPYEDLKSGKVDIRNLSQKKYCKIHEEQVVRFYCETCGVLTCRDCTVVDHPASSHNLVNLESASKGHKKEIEQLIQGCDTIKIKTDDALKEIDSVLDQLVENAATAEAGIDESFNEAMKLLEDSRDQLKGELTKAASDRKKQLDAQKDEIMIQQTRLQTALQMANEVVKTGSDYDLALIYTSLKTNLTELRGVKLASVDKQKAAVHFKPAHIGQKTAQKLGSVLVKQRKEGVGFWKLDRSFGDVGAEKLKYGRGVAITQEGDIAVADMADSAVKIYKKDGQFKSSITVPDNPWNVVVSSDGKLIVTNLSASVSIYDGKGNQKHQFPTKSPDNVSSDTRDTTHWGLAIDNYNNLLVGETRQKYISKHHLDGAHITSFKVPISPVFITVSLDAKIFISGGMDTDVHILNENGVHLQTLTAPQDSGWSPYGMCCTSANEIYISNTSSGVIYCYSAETGAYIGCLTKDVSKPAGLALMNDENQLVVVEDYCIKIFKVQNQ